MDFCEGVGCFCVFGPFTLVRCNVCDEPLDGAEILMVKIPFMD